MTELSEANAASLFPDRSPPPMLDIIGPYVGKVLKNDDSEDEDGRLGRLKVWVPQLYGEEYEDKPDELPWALPLAWTLAGVAGEDDKVKRGTFLVPLEEMWTHVFFRRGDIDDPLWFGGWYGKPDGPEIPNEFLESDYGARYPEIPGIVIPPLAIRLHGVKVPQAATIEWGKEGDPDIKLEIDETPWQHDVPTVHLKIKPGRKSDWKLVIENEASGGIEIKAKEKILIECKELEIKASDVIDAQATGEDGGRGFALWHGKAQNIFSSEGKITGVAPAARGFEDHG
jgi:hypothetical protein